MNKSINKLIVKGLLYSCIGLILAIYFDHLITSNADFFKLLSKYGNEITIGRIFGNNPYIYYIFGTYVGFILCLLFRLLIKGAFKELVWSITMVIGGIVVFWSKDMLLVVTIFSFAPGMAIYDAGINEVKRV